MLVARPPDSRTPAHARRSAEGAGRRARVSAVVPASASPAAQAVVCCVMRTVDRVVLIDRAAAVGQRLADFAGESSVTLLAPPGPPAADRATALQLGVAHALGEQGCDALLVLDPDAGVRCDRVDALLEALEGHDAVIGVRPGATPRRSAARRFFGWLTAALARTAPGVPVEQARYGMRVFSAAALRRVPFDPEDGRHLEAMLAAGLDVHRVAVPAAASAA